MSGIQIEVAWDPSRLSHLLKKGEAMARRLESGLGGDTLYDFRDGWEPDDFLYPAYAFEHLSYIVNDPDLTHNEEGNPCVVGCPRAGGYSSPAPPSRRQAAGSVR
jgi:hypothetical protein